MAVDNFKIKQPGYVYIYLSNENEIPVEVYFDDFKVEHVKSSVVQMDDYYPFGMRYNSYARENSTPNKTKLFQGQEHIDDLGLNWDSFKWRNHQPDIGRFFNVDPLAEKYVYNTPYAFSENHVTSHVELEGLEKINFMVAIFNPNDQIHSGGQIHNQNFTDVNKVDNKQMLTFTADFDTGKISNEKGEDNEVNLVSYAIALVMGDDPHRLDYTLTKDGRLNITVKIGDSKFKISGKSDGKQLTLKTEISGVQSEDGAVIQGSADGDSNLPFVAGTKKGGTTDDSVQTEEIPYTTNDENQTEINHEYLTENRDTNQAIPTTTQ